MRSYPACYFSYRASLILGLLGSSRERASWEANFLYLDTHHSLPMGVSVKEQNLSQNSGSEEESICRHVSYVSRGSRAPGVPWRR